MTSRRAVCLHWLFLIWGVVLILRLGYWQIYRGPGLKLAAAAQQSTSVIIPASRGQIQFSDGFPMVDNTDNYLLYSEPKKLPADLTGLLKILDPLPSSASAKANLSSAGARSELLWVSISDRVTPQVKAAIEAVKTTGLGFELAPIRAYPEGTPSAYISGFVGQDDAGASVGYFGLEGYYDRLLSGTPGRLVEDHDAFGLPIVIGGSYRIPPKNGTSLLTSIDRTVQYIAYQHLVHSLQKYQSPSGTVTILESQTGRVLAMVSIPGYDPGLYSQFDAALYKNPIVSDSYEPGSTFKTVVMASALDTGAVDPDMVCDICSGPAVIGDSTVRGWNDKYYPQSTMSDVILHSDNVGMVFVSRRLGKTKMLEYLHKFGIGNRTGIDLQEEDVTPLRPDNQWHDIDWATAAFGQGIAVTPLQMTAAVNVLANKGLYLPPRIVTHTVSQDKVQPVAGPAPKKVISYTAAAAITQMMVNGVTNGEVRYYRPAGYVIAGKTGTAQVPIAGHYDPDKVVASFVGFAPAYDPKFTMLVTLRDPKPSPWGSTTAAPTWFGIASELFRYYRIPPVVN